jgi:hypothetical protein
MGRAHAVAIGFGRRILVRTQNPVSRVPGARGVVAGYWAQGILLWRAQPGTPFWAMGCEPVVFGGGPCDLPGCAASAYRSVSFANSFSCR